MQRWLGLVAVAALLLQSGCAECYRTVSLEDSDGFRLSTKLDLAELERLVAKGGFASSTFTAPSISAGIVILVEKDSPYGIVFSNRNDAVYVNFAGTTTSCFIPLNLKPLLALIDRLPVSDSQRQEIRMNVKERVERHMWSLPC
jgi:hypothetical protein